jgi:hypothetical protein
LAKRALRLANPVSPLRCRGRLQKVNCHEFSAYRHLELHTSVYLTCLALSITHSVLAGNRLGWQAAAFLLAEFLHARRSDALA